MKELFHRIIIIGFVRGLGAISMFVMTLLIAKFYDSHQSGLFFLTLTIVNFLVIFGLLGLDQAILKLIGQYSETNSPGKQLSILKTSFFTVTLLLITITILIIYLSDIIANEIYNKPELSSYLIQLAPAIVFLGLISISAHFFQAVEKTMTAVFLLSISIPFTFSIILLLVHDIFSLIQTSYFYLATTLFFSFLSLLFIKRNIKHPITIIQVPLSEIWPVSFPLWNIVIMNQVIQWSGLILAGIWVTSAEIAYLTVAQRLAAILTFILIVVNMILAPKFAASWKRNDMVTIKKLTYSSTLFMIVFSMPLMLFIFLFPSTLLSFFGDSYVTGSTVFLIIYSIGQFINIITGPTTYLLMMTDHQKNIRNLVLLSTLIALITGLILIPIYGAIAAAFSTVVAVSFLNIGSVYLTHKHLHFNPIAIWNLK